VGGLAANILVVNNYRDVETDAKANKRTLVVKWGRGYARAQFAAAHGLAVGVPVVLAWQGGANLVAALVVALAAGAAAICQIRQLGRASSPAECIALLGKTGRWLAVYGLLLSAAIGVR
jgi:1,4-dihydroxy-2-naphthoate polyprenyltransferase